MPEPMQQTLVLLKPDCVQRRLVGTIIQRLEQKGLRLAALKLVQAGGDLAEKRTGVHKLKLFEGSLGKYVTLGPPVAMVWEGREAVAVVGKLMGDSDGTKAADSARRGFRAVGVAHQLAHDRY